MKAILYTRFGGPEVLQLTEVDNPVPKDHQVLVKVHAASVNAMDWRRFTMGPILPRVFDGGLLTPKDTSIGGDVAGTVEAVGSSVTDFKPGDEVFGVAPGAFAEYACNAASKFALKPAHVSFEAAAAVPVAAFTALQGLRDKGRIQAGQKVLIYGASGGVGTMAVQIAKSFGAEVTAVCRTRNLDMVRSMGADHVIDYTQEDFTRNGQLYDLIYVANGYRPLLDYRKALGTTGSCVVAGGSLALIFQTMLLARLVSRAGGQQIGFQGVATTPQQDLLVLRELLETGKIVPVIDRSYPLSETAEAMRYLIDEHARGKVVITVAEDEG